jgi:hypothetical protein
MRRRGGRAKRDKECGYGRVEEGLGESLMGAHNIFAAQTLKQGRPIGEGRHRGARGAFILLRGSVSAPEIVADIFCTAPSGGRLAG